eukprot:1755806-Pyramimonas_sp.AAC.1
MWWGPDARGDAAHLLHHVRASARRGVKSARSTTRRSLVHLSLLTGAPLAAHWSPVASPANLCKSLQILTNG